MKKRNKLLSENRRHFMKKSALTSAAIAVSAVASGGAIATPGDESHSVEESRGYQLTPHVLAYYKSAAS